MDGDSQTTLILILILLGLAAYFAIAETALSSVSHTRIRLASEHGDPRAKSALYTITHFDQAITTLLICTNIVHISVASIVTVFVTRKWGLSYVSLSTIVTTIVVFFVGEMVPKSIAKKNSEGCLLGTAGLLMIFIKICTPLAFVLTAIGNLAASLTRQEPEITVTEDELYDIIEDMEESGAIDEDQGELFSSALQFSDLTVDSILTPRVDMVAIDADGDPLRILNLIKETTHSRLPVYERTPDNIIGILKIRDYLSEYLREHTYPNIRALMDLPYFIPQSTPIAELLENMSSKKVNLAVITDSYGGTLGIVTIEDILEELVGEIWDEDDKIKEPIVQLSEQVWLVEAEETVSDALDEMDVEVESEEDEEEFKNLQIGEWVYQQFTEIPKAGDSFTYQGLIITIDRMSRNRILYVKIEKPEQTENEEGGEQA